jgi:hypothetical protein
MNIMRSVLPYCLFIFVITSCASTSKKQLITGKWTFDKFELPKNFSPGSINY